ncbi:MAG: DUF4097 family beta strand repeat-containing protein, partial [Bacteroidota bacterium]
MKKIYIISVLSILLVYSNTLYSQRIVEKSSPVSSEDDITLVFKFANEIKITTWDKNEVFVKASVNINDNKNNDNFELNFKQRSTGLEIESEIINMDDLRQRKRIVKEDKNGDEIIINNCTVEMELFFEVKVPVNAGIEIETISGDIEIDGVLGRMDINTISGFIDLSLPENHNADIELNTISGNMYSDFDFKSDVEKGYHHYRHREISKRINQGGSRIFLKTISGNI